MRSNASEEKGKKEMKNALPSHAQHRRHYSIYLVTTLRHAFRTPSYSHSSLTCHVTLDNININIKWYVPRKILQLFFVFLPFSDKNYERNERWKKKCGRVERCVCAAIEGWRWAPRSGNAEGEMCGDGDTKIWFLCGDCEVCENYAIGWLRTRFGMPFSDVTFLWDAQGMVGRGSRSAGLTVDYVCIYLDILFSVVYTTSCCVQYTLFPALLVRHIQLSSLNQP